MNQSRQAWVLVLTAVPLTWILLATASRAQDPPAESPEVYVRVTTSLGDMVLELSPARAPVTVENFLSYVDEGYYTGTVFHRVVKDFMIQGGGMLPDYTPKETKPPIKNEANNGLKNVYGSIAMARKKDPDSATSQFFINTSDNQRLDHTAEPEMGWGYCVFGKVIDGFDTLEAIRSVPVHPDPKADPTQPAAPDTPVIIEKIERVPEEQREQVLADARAAEASRPKQPSEIAQAEGIQYVAGKGVDVSKGVTTDSGLWYADVQVGEGASPPSSSARVTVHYTGWFTNGTQFDSSRDEEAKPATFALNRVVKGWTEGVGSMKVGGKRYLVIPPHLAYGAAGRPGIPGNATLVFEIELLEIPG